MSGMPEEPTFHPACVAPPDEAICERHGEMKRVDLVVKRNGTIYFPKEGVAGFGCYQCCRELVATGGADEQALKTIPPKELIDQFLSKLTYDRWGGMKHLFQAVGDGEMSDDRVAFEIDNPDAIPEHVKESADFYLEEP